MLENQFTGFFDRDIQGPGYFREQLVAAETDLLINLADEIPMFFSRFQRVVEVVSEDKQSRESGRNRFRFYRDRGYDLRTHQLR